MPIEIIMPKVDMVMESGTFVEWLKKDGETVRKGEPLFVIMTDKSAIECESPANGTLVGICAKPDDVLPVTTIIGYIQAPGEEPLQAVPASRPVVAAAALEKPAGNPQIAAIGASERSAAAPAQQELLRATPLARRLALEYGVDLHKIEGRGPHGRIYKADVLAAGEAAAANEAARPTVPLTGSVKTQEAAGEAVQSIGSIQRTAGSVSIRLPDARVQARIPLKGIRAITAERLSYSSSAFPHIYLGLSVDMSEVLRWREQVGACAATTRRTRPSITAIISFVVAHLLPAHPYLNASLIENEIVLWDEVHLGIATALEDDLIVPVVRGAQRLSLDETVLEMARLLEVAREKRLLPGEMSGSTFTISNLGMYGVEDFTAILNPPEAAILGVGKMIEIPVVLDGQISVRPMVHMTLGTDHRVNDGARGARFLSDLKNMLENPYLLL